MGLVLIGVFALQGENKMQANPLMHKHTNGLIEETSPYLLQHAHNPVNWMPWGTEAFELARKMPLVSRYGT